MLCAVPASVQAVSAIPQSTLQALLPVLSGIDPAKLTAQLKLLGQQDRETIDKMIFFLKAVRTCFTTLRSTLVVGLLYLVQYYTMILVEDRCTAAAAWHYNRTALKAAIAAPNS